MEVYNNPSVHCVLYRADMIASLFAKIFLMNIAPIIDMPDKGKRSIKPWQVRRLAVTPYGMPPASLDSKAGAYSSPTDSWVSGTSYPEYIPDTRTPADR